MIRKVLKCMFLFLALVVLVTVLVTPGCTAGNTPAGNAPASTTGQSGQGPQRNPDFMKNVLAKVADKLGVSVDTLTQAYQQAQSQVPAPARPQGQPGAGGSDNRTGNRSAYMAALADKMSTALNIPADQITAAFQAASNELRPGGSNQRSQ